MATTATEAVFVLLIAGAVAASSPDLTSNAATLSEPWQPTPIVLPRGQPVNQTLGPQAAVYCKLTDPSQRLIFEGHGRCNLALDRVTNDHAGVWVMQVGLQGNMLTETYRITAEVRGTRDKPSVSVSVAGERPELILMCSVPVQDEVKSCLFQDPSGRVIMSEKGATQDRYESIGTGATVNGGVMTYECGVRINSMTTSDLGQWRCALETEQEVYYGFLRVMSRRGMMDPEINETVVWRPRLTANQQDVEHLSGDSLTLTCSVQTRIRYCYFRGPNGITYDVSPAVATEEYEYVGAGLDAGECGIRFHRLEAPQPGHWPQGRWSCHVGFFNETRPEQRADIQVQIRRPIEANQYLGDRGLVVEAEVFQQRAVEYCRYVRIDGLGFTSSNLPEERYFSTEQRSQGRCGLRIENPTTLDLHPWTVTAKLVGREEEFSDNTNSMQSPDPEAETTKPWQPTPIVLPRGQPVNQTLGPQAAVYCKLTDPTQQLIFEGHGRCNLALDRVTNDHAGIWVMQVALQGNMLTTTYRITAQVRGTRDKPSVSVSVTGERPELILMCSVPVQDEVKSCLFQDPSGRVIVSNEGATQDRYQSVGSGVTVNGGVMSYECGVRINSMTTSDLGQWRCALETEQEVYYGFLRVMSRRGMMDPEINETVVWRPRLTANQEDVEHLSGDSLTLTCSVQTRIRYCYFRGPNGNTYGVSPAISTEEYEYVGAGLDAGECGIRFHRLEAPQPGHWPQGRWSCHVGFFNETRPEQRADIQVQIKRPIEANQYLGDRGLVVEAEVFQQRAVEYCRYVRIDGLGFTSANLPEERYFSTEQRTQGHCGLIIENPTTLDLHPWTVAAKLVGREEEFSDVTDHSMQSPEPGTTNTKNTIWIWCTAVISAALLISAAILFIPAKNRRNTIARATSWKNSFRSSIQKKPLEDEDVGRSSPPQITA